MNDIVPTRGADASPLSRDDKLPEPGEYWRYTGESGEKRNSIMHGRVYMVATVNVIDGEIHSVEMLAHPEESVTRKHLFEEFIENHEHAPHGQKDRDAEIAKVQARIEELQRRLQHDTQTTVPTLLNDRSVSNQPQKSLTDGAEADTVGALIAGGQSVESLMARQRERQEMMVAKSEEIKKISTSLTGETETLSAYYQERAKGSLAAVSTVLDYAKNLEKGITTLGLFAGTGVDVETLKEGKRSKDDKIHIMQRMLYIDEELACDLEEGGADYESFSKLEDMVRNDPAMLDQLAPFDKTIVLLRWRRHDKNYEKAMKGTSPTMADAFEAMMRNQANKEQFLLVRNGENVFTVHADDALQNIPRLFPRMDDLEAHYRKRRYFSGMDSESITPGDLDYDKARSKFEAMALEFRRVLILLYGLDQRLQLFGNFYDRSSGTSFLSLDFQEKHFEFVADEENALFEDRPSLDELFAAQNAKLRPGARAIVMWRKAVDEESCPTAVEIDMKYCRTNFVYEPDHWMTMETVERRGDKLAVIMDSKHRWTDRPRRLAVDLKKAPGHSFLILDGLKSERLRWYLGNRTAREDYLRYVGGFKLAIKVLEAEEERAAKAIADMLERAGGPSRRQILENAVTAWRSANSNIELPSDGKELETAKKRILSLVGQMDQDGPNDEERATVEAIAASEGETVTRWSRTVSGEIRVETYKERVQPGLHFQWARSFRVKANGKRVTDSFVIPFRDDPGLIEIERPEGAEKLFEPAEGSILTDAKPEDLFRLNAALRQPDETQAWKYMFGENAPVDMKHINALASKLERRRINEVVCTLPIGAYGKGDRYRMLSLLIDMHSLSAKTNEEGRRSHEEWLKRTLKHPQRLLDAISDTPIIGWSSDRTFKWHDAPAPSYGTGAPLDGRFDKELEKCTVKSAAIKAILLKAKELNELR